MSSQEEVVEPTQPAKKPRLTPPIIDDPNEPAEMKAAKAEFRAMTAELFAQMEKIYRGKWCSMGSFAGTFDFNDVTFKAYMVGSDGEQAIEVPYKISLGKSD